MVSPVMEAVVPTKPLRLLVPVYPLTEGITQNFLKSVTQNALNTLVYDNYAFPEIFESDTLEKMGIMSLKDALLEIHFPTDTERVQKARERFVFEELYAFALGISMAKNRKAQGVKNTA